MNAKHTVEVRLSCIVAKAKTNIPFVLNIDKYYSKDVLLHTNAEMICVKAGNMQHEKAW